MFFNPSLTINTFPGS